MTEDRRRANHAPVNGSSTESPGPRAPWKLAETVASRIEQRVVDDGWPVGEVIGSEAELLDQYQVSRGVLREAIRIVEHHLVADMRRGRGGGLVVRKPEAAAVTKAMMLYLQYRKVQLTALYETRKALELSAVEFAAQRINEDGIKRLRDYLAGESEMPVDVRMRQRAGFHVMMAELSGNPVTELYVRCITNLVARLYKSSQALADAARESHDSHVLIVDAVVSGDAALARHRMARHLDVLAEMPVYRE